jgi:hypothetical protein
MSPKEEKSRQPEINRRQKIMLAVLVALLGTSAAIGFVLQDKVADVTNSLLPAGTPEATSPGGIVPSENPPTVPEVAPPLQFSIGAFTDITNTLPFMPDGAVSIVQVGNDVALFTSGTQYSYMVQGNILQDWQKMLQVVTPERTQSEKGVLGYRGIASVIRLDDGRLLAFEHVEYHDPNTKNPDGTTLGAYAAEVHMTQSFDGITWTPSVPIAFGSNPPVRANENDRFASGAGMPSAVRVHRENGDIIKLFFTDWNGNRADEIYSAEVPIADVFDPAKWVINYDQPAIPRPTEEDSYSALPSVVFDTQLGKYLLTFGTAKGIYITSSDDAANWQQPQMIIDLAAHPEMKYASLFVYKGKHYIAAARSDNGAPHRPIVAELHLVQ